MSEDTFNLRYGKTQIELSQSRTLIGIRPSQPRTDSATSALSRTLGDDNWREAGVVGGFRIVAIKDAGIDLDGALDEIRRDSTIAVGTHVFEVPGGRGIYVPTGDLLVEFKAGTPDDARQALLDKYALSVKEAREEDGLIVSVTRKSPNPIKVAAGLQESDVVTIAEPDLATKTALKSPSMPIDVLISDQWHLRNTGFHRNSRIGFVKGADARVLEAWTEARTTGSAEVIVAVIDDGFDLSHPDFSAPGKVVHPWDFTRRNSHPTPEQGDWHGTACAGVAVAAAGGGSVVGAAPGCTLMPIRWGPDLSDGQIEAWFKYVTQKGAWVVSCSWGAQNPFFPLSTRAERALERCAKSGRGGRGCVIVFAAGNDDRDINDPRRGTVDGFAIHPNVVAVAASTSRDARSDYSNFGKEISVCAPSSGAGGWGILTDDVTGLNVSTGRPLGYAEGDYTYDFGGTSSACPLVAGVAALVLSVNPTLTSAEVKALLQESARKIGDNGSYDAAGHSHQFGYGCVNAVEAVKRAKRANRNARRPTGRETPERPATRW
jgi:subtilisin family serine protease